MISLEAGKLYLEVAPQWRGSIVSFQYEGRDILRPATLPSGEVWQARDLSAFPMCPFVGRISHGEFSFNGQSHALPPNMPPEPHAIHGFGWQTPWAVSEQTDRSVSLSHTGPDIWPWPYEATLVFCLWDDRLSITLSLTNQSDQPMPSGLGWHPYFLRKNAIITASTEDVWIPATDTSRARTETVSSRFDLRRPRRVESLDIDHAFRLTHPRIDIDTDDFHLVLKGDPCFGHAIVYVPPGEDFFCAELSTQAPDAVNISDPIQQAGLISLEPKASLSANLELNVSPKAR